MSHREQDAYTTAVQRHDPNSLSSINQCSLGYYQALQVENEALKAELKQAKAELKAGRLGMSTLSKEHEWEVSVSGVATCRQCRLEVPYTNYSLPETICVSSLPVPADDLEQANAEVS
jgi:hypothetical protein